MGARDALGEQFPEQYPDFSIEPPMAEGRQPPTTLHVGGKPYPLAIHRAGTHYSPNDPMTPDLSHHGWMIPFESGWEIHLRGQFNRQGEATMPMTAHAHHEPTRQSAANASAAFGKRPTELQHIPVLHFPVLRKKRDLEEVIRQTSEQPGGGTGRHAP